MPPDDCWRCQLYGRERRPATQRDPFFLDGIRICFQCVRDRLNHPNRPKFR